MANSRRAKAKKETTSRSTGSGKGPVTARKESMGRRRAPDDRRRSGARRPVASEKPGAIEGLPFSIRAFRQPMGSGGVAGATGALKAMATELDTAGGETGIRCPLFKSELERIVVAVIQSFHPNRVVKLDREFENDLGIDSPTRRIYLEPIVKRMRDQGCEISGLDPADLEECERVQDVADKVWNARR
jgi:hypothetical protein